jgi:hypothetical protein
MALDRSVFEGQSLEYVADRTADAEPGSQVAHMGQTEFLLRQTAAQIAASTATEETAVATKKYVRLMLVSVIILALSSLASLAIDVAILVKQ